MEKGTGEIELVQILRKLYVLDIHVMRAPSSMGFSGVKRMH